MIVLTCCWCWFLPAHAIDAGGASGNGTYWEDASGDAVHDFDAFDDAAGENADDAAWMVLLEMMTKLGRSVMLMLMLQMLPVMVPEHLLAQMHCCCCCCCHH